jgi:splicing factor 3A subunit 3
LFSGEENFGKFLDLNELHQEYINLKDVPLKDYSSYVASLDKFEAITETSKNANYTKYFFLMAIFIDVFIKISGAFI